MEFLLLFNMYLCTVSKQLSLSAPAAAGIITAPHERDSCAMSVNDIQL